MNILITGIVCAVLGVCLAIGLAKDNGKSKGESLRLIGGMPAIFLYLLFAIFCLTKYFGIQSIWAVQ